MYNIYKKKYQTRFELLKWHGKLKDISFSVEEGEYVAVMGELVQEKQRFKYLSANSSPTVQLLGPGL